MLEYELECSIKVTPTERLDIQVTILRSVDGAGFEEVASFRQEVKSAVADSAIVTKIRDRFDGYCKADSNRIAKEDLTNRAIAIQNAVDGIRYTL